MTTLAERIRTSRREAGFTTQRQLAEAVGVQRATVTQWESGETRSIGGKYLPRLARVLQRNPEWLQYGKGPMHPVEPGNEVRHAHEPRAGYGPGPSLTQDVLVPICRVPLRLRETEGSVNIEETGDYLAFSRGWLHQAGISASDLVIFVVQDDSMSPLLRGGDHVLVQKGNEVIDEGAIYALLVPGGVMFRRLKRSAGGDIVVYGDNPATSTEHVPKDEVDQLHIFGRAIQRTGLLNRSPR